MANPTNTAGVVNRASPLRTIVAVNGNAGAYVLLSASQGSWGYIEVAECPAAGYTGGAFTGQGLSYQRADENYATTYYAAPGEIIQVGDAIKKNQCVGVGGFTYPDASVRAATPYLKVKSASATATNVQLREWRCLAGQR